MAKPLVPACALRVNSDSSGAFGTRNMRFTLVDRIVLLEPGAKIVTVKTLSLAEEYLADHFPRFPVMPGVLMLEAMTQSVLGSFGHPSSTQHRHTEAGP